MTPHKRNKTTRNQLIGAFVLIALLLAVHLTIAWLSRRTPTAEVPQTTIPESNAEKRRQPIPFDPNKADSLTLLYNGLKPWQIRNMMKYRVKGGRYRKPDDFSRLYGLTDSAFQALKPYIRIDSTEWIARRDSFALLRRERDSLRHLADSLRRDSLYPKTYRHPKCDTIIELNAADTFALQFIRGIGVYTAKQIVQYRHDLGGYVSPEQVREINSLRGVNLDSVIPHLTANPDSVRPLRVNYCSVEQLQRHPYISFTQAKAIYTLRRNRLKLKGIDDLKNVDCLTDSILLRLNPYLSFEP